MSKKEKVTIEAWLTHLDLLQVLPKFEENDHNFVDDVELFGREELETIGIPKKIAKTLAAELPGPLPDGWVKRIGKSGRPFYGHKDSKETQWKRPDGKLLPRITKKDKEIEPADDNVDAPVKDEVPNQSKQDAKKAAKPDSPKVAKSESAKVDKVKTPGTETKSKKSSVAASAPVATAEVEEEANTQSADEDGEGKLPRGWVYKRKNGVAYYKNNARKATTPLRPTNSEGDSSDPDRPEVPDESDELPPGWMRARKGDKYFYSHKAKQISQWIAPRLKKLDSAPPPDPDEQDDADNAKVNDVIARNGDEAVIGAKQKGLPPPNLAPAPKKKSKSQPVEAKIDVKVAVKVEAKVEAKRANAKIEKLDDEPLPPGWVKLKKDGYIFYGNKFTQKTQFSRPFAEGESNLPPDWVAKETVDGRTYYGNLVTKETRWTSPADKTCEVDQPRAPIVPPVVAKSKPVGHSRPSAVSKPVETSKEAYVEATPEQTPEDVPVVIVRTKPTAPAPSVTKNVLQSSVRDKLAAAVGKLSTVNAFALPPGRAAALPADRRGEEDGEPDAEQKKGFSPSSVMGGQGAPLTKAQREKAERERLRRERADAG